jgi:hypothetical protein
MLTGETLLHADIKDNIFDQRQLKELYDFTDEFKSEKLSEIMSALGRNLVAQLLNKDQNKRPSMVCD